MSRFQHITLSNTDFANSGWQDVVDATAEKNCRSYYPEFFQRVAEAQTNGDSVNEKMFVLLGAVCSMELRPDTSEVFHPYYEWYDPPDHGPVLADFNDEHIAVLAEIAPDTRDAEMRARLADVVWVKGRSKYYQLVEIAVRAYVESAKWMLSSLERGALFADLRLRRALSLAKSIRNQPLFDSALKEVEEIVSSHDENDQEFPFAIMFRVLLAYSSHNPAAFSELSEKLAKVSENQSSWREAQNYWQIKAEWDIRAGNANDQRESLIQAAEAHVKVSEIYTSAEQPNYGAACFELTRAIEILRSVGGMQARCEEIHNSILSYQRASVDDLQHVSASINITEFVLQAQQIVKEKPLDEAILGLALVALHPTNRQDIRAQVEEYLEQASLQIILPMAMVDAEGRRIATSPSLLNATEDEREKIIKTRMFMEANHLQQLAAAAIIEPIVYQISLDHYVQMHDLAFLVLYNSFVPSDRIHIFLRGLYAGFQGDYLVAAHLLIPQIENSLRYILGQRGTITRSLNAQTGVEEHFALDKLLGMPELKDILGEDIIFDLQCILIGRFGSNLRNDLAHGLVQSDKFSSYTIVYLWWLVLHLCCYGLPSLQGGGQEGQNAQ